MDSFELCDVAKIFAIVALIGGWKFVSRRLPGYYGKAVDGSVEIVPTAGMWLSAIVLPVISFSLIALLSLTLYRVPTMPSLIMIPAAILWAAAFAMGISAIKKVAAVRKHRIRYDSWGLSYRPARGKNRAELSFSEIDRIETRLFGPSRLHSGAIAIPFTDDEGGGRQLAQLIEQDLISRGTDRASG